MLRNWLCNSIRKRCFHAKTLHKHFLGDDAFSRQIAIEQSRSDRFGIPFVVMRFNVSPEIFDYQTKALQVLASVLHDRSRLIDTKGWFDNQLAIILPGADQTNAAIVWKAFLDLFLQRFSLDGRSVAVVSEPFICELFIYPELPQSVLSSKRVSVPNLIPNVHTASTTRFASRGDYKHNANKALDGIV